MTSKEFLDRPYHIKKKIRYLELELDRYHTMIYSIPTPSFNAVRVDKKAELERVIAEITTVIDRIDNEDYKLLLKYRYIDLKNITEIANLLFISIRTAQRWHRLALEEIILEA